MTERWDFDGPDCGQRYRDGRILCICELPVDHQPPHICNCDFSWPTPTPEGPT